MSEVPLYGATRLQAPFGSWSHSSVGAICESLSLLLPILELSGTKVLGVGAICYRCSCGGTRLQGPLQARDWYFIAEQPAPAPHLAQPGGCAALRIVLVTVPDGFDS